jgi:hypothetical protein
MVDVLAHNDELHARHGASLCRLFEATARYASPAAYRAVGAQLLA